MTVFNMCTSDYQANYNARSDLSGRTQVLSRRFIGTDLTALTTTATDSFKIFKIGKHQLVKNVKVIVTDADDTSITVSLGYTDGTNTSATAFEADANLNSTGVTSSADDIVFFDDDGYFIVMTLGALSTLDAATEWVVMVEVDDLSNVGVTEALTTPV